MGELEFVDFTIEEQAHYNHDQKPYRETVVYMYFDAQSSESIVVKSTLEQMRYFINCVIKY